MPSPDHSAQRPEPPMTPRPQVVCLTPVKNEAWILDRFLTCASAWADHIVVADQGSDDGSREIASRFPKVRLIENSAQEFNEPERQKLLIEAARRIPGQKLLIALDADEFLTATALTSVEWELILGAVPGTVINFQWACVLPDRKSYYLFPTEFPLGYMDDGAEHAGRAIHSPRLPIPPDRPSISLRAIKVMHFSTIDFGRFKSKVRWYQCWEFLKDRWQGRLIELYRWYHRDFCVPDRLVRPLPDDWVSGYGPSIDLLGVPTQTFYRWDEEILQLFDAHGTSKFRKLAIWDQDWEAMHELIKKSPPPRSLRDPRSWLERTVHSWLERTQPFYSHGAEPPNRLGRLSHSVVERVLGTAGW